MKHYTILTSLITLVIATTTIPHTPPIPLYAHYTPSHEILFEHYFLPTLKQSKNNFELHAHTYSQKCTTGEYCATDWYEAMHDKITTILRAIDENWNSIFIFSDVDIIFLSRFDYLIPQMLASKDIVFQAGVCACRIGPEAQKPRNSGFFIARGNEQTKAFWQHARTLLSPENRYLDPIVNQLLARRAIPLLADGYLPLECFHPGLRSENPWQPGDEIKLPKKLMVHHACYTAGLDNKIKQLDYVLEKVFKLHAT